MHLCSQTQQGKLACGSWGPLSALWTSGLPFPYLQRTEWAGSLIPRHWSTGVFHLLKLSAVQGKMKEKMKEEQWVLPKELSEFLLLCGGLPNLVYNVLYFVTYVLICAFSYEMIAAGRLSSCLVYMYLLNRTQSWQHCVSSQHFFWGGWGVSFHIHQIKKSGNHQVWWK